MSPSPRFWSRVSAVLALSLSLATGLAAQPFAYSVESDGDDSLYLIDLATGTKELIGPVGFDDVEGTDLAPDGTLYGWDDNTDRLIRIDPQTGAGTAIGTATDVVEGVPGLTICPDGTIYLAALDFDPRGFPSVLYEVDPSDSSLFEIGSFPVPGAIQAIACDAEGTLYGINDPFDARSLPDSHLWRIDRNDACPTDLGPLGITFAQGDIDFGPDGLLYGINDGAIVFRGESEAQDARGEPTPPSGPIFEIDVDVPSGFQSGNTMPGGHEGLAVLADPSVLEIPTVSQLGLFALILGLGLAALARMRSGL